MSDRYGSDVLSSNPHVVPKRVIPVVEAAPGLVVECANSGFCGSVVRTEKDIAGVTVELEDRKGKRRVFVMAPGAFLIDGKPTTLVRPAAKPIIQKRSASGAIRTGKAAARVARASRIWVEGVHDAELVEKIWGDDLRSEAVVVEPLHGADHLIDALKEFAPGEGRRVGVLLDHLVAGSKERKLADFAHSRFAPDVLVVGHPYVDVWQAVKPSVVGIDEWPTIPMGTPWKQGIIDALGWRCDEREAWQKILDSVHTYTDLEPSMLGRVEQLVDFVADVQAE